MGKTEKIEKENRHMNNHFFQGDVEETDAMIKKIFDDSLRMMLEKNRSRGDCWRGVGLKGAFLEIRASFMRLKNLAWYGSAPVLHGDEAVLEYKKELLNVLVDLRCFAVLGEMSVLTDNWEGDDDIDSEL